MADPVTIEVKGLRDAIRELDRLTDKVTGQKILRRVASKALAPMKLYAKSNATLVKESGAMAAAISLTTRLGGTVRGLAANDAATRNTAVTGAVYTRNKSKRALAIYNAYHGRDDVSRLRHFHLVEFGTARTRAKAPVTKAYEQAKRRVIPDLATLLRAELAKLR